MFCSRYISLHRLFVILIFFIFGRWHMEASRRCQLSSISFFFLPKSHLVVPVSVKSRACGTTADGRSCVKPPTSLAYKQSQLFYVFLIVYFAKAFCLKITTHHIHSSINWGFSFSSTRKSHFSVFQQPPTVFQKALHAAKMSGKYWFYLWVIYY